MNERKNGHTTAAPTINALRDQLFAPAETSTAHTNTLHLAQMHRKPFDAAPRARYNNNICTH
jgi:hypothetical protein